LEFPVLGSDFGWVCLIPGDLPGQGRGHVCIGDPVLGFVVCLEPALPIQKTFLEMYRSPPGRLPIASVERAVHVGC
jgi:hypothetical protein